MQLEQLQLLLDWSPAGLFMTDMEGCCTYMNPHAKAICQSDPGASRRPWAQALGIENSNGVMESWLSRAGLEYSGMFRVCRPDSTSRWIEVRTVPVHAVQARLQATPASCKTYRNDGRPIGESPRAMPSPGY